jgi:DNA-binding HxlR family transcriptional regulator
VSTERTPLYATDDGAEERTTCELAGEAFDQLGSEWRLKVLYTLHEEGELRFNELKRATGASSRTLSRVLDDLQEFDLVERRLEEDAPVATYYRETQKALDLCPVFQAVDEWASEYI